MMIGKDVKQTVCRIVRGIILIFNSKLKKLKVARWGLCSTVALGIADCALAPDVVPSFISRGATTSSGAGTLY
jgi:hypothetical protein